MGDELQVAHTVALSATPPSATDITVTVASESTALLSTSRDAVRAKSVTFTGVTSTAGRTLYVQGLVQGTTTITAQAAGFADQVSTVSVMPSGFALWNIGNFTTTTFSTNTTLFVRPWRLSSTGALSANQELRAGADPAAVAVTSSDPAVGAITASPVTFTGGGGHALTTEFDPLTAGTTTVAITQPAGFTVPSSGVTSVTATVTE